MRTLKYNVSYEKLISRLPALFAYVNIDEQGTPSVVNAIQGEQGNYGKIVADLICPKFPTTSAFYECKDGTKLQLSAGRHSYRSAIDVYYRFIDDVREYLKADWDKLSKERIAEWERKIQEGEPAESPYKTFDEVFNEEIGVTKTNDYSEFVNFIERGIGLEFVGLSEEYSDETDCGREGLKKYPLAPDYIYLATASKLYEKVYKIKKQIEFWECHMELCKEDEKYYLKILKEYELMNGDKLLDVLESLIEKAQEVADEYYEEYAVKPNPNDRNNVYKSFPTINFNVNLTNKIKDLGLVTPYIQEWVPGKAYYHGDVVYYADENGYGMTWVCDLDDATDVQIDEFGKKYINGYYDEETELIYFENGVTDLPSYWKPQSFNWVNRNHRYICAECGRVYYNNKPERCICKNTTFVEKRYVKEDEGGNIPDTVTLRGTCNSHLSSLKRYETYMDGDVVERPDNGKDWLWYYRVGTINNREALYDENGNLVVVTLIEDGGKAHIKGVEPIIDNGDNVVFSDDNKNYALNLAIWGDVLTNIEAKNEETFGKITFEYWLGAHLKAKKGLTIQAKEDFSVGGQIYKVGDIISESVFKGLSDSNENKVKFIVNESFVNGGKFYKKGSEIIDNISPLNEKNVEYIAKYDFRNIFTFESEEISRHMYEDILNYIGNIHIYATKEFTFTFDVMHLGVEGLVDVTFHTGDVVEHWQYVQLSEEYREFYVKFMALEPFEFDKKFAMGDVVDVELYRRLSEIRKKNNITIYASISFTDGGDSYIKGDSGMTYGVYEKLDTINKSKVNITITESFVEPKTYKKGTETSPSIYASLSDDNKAKVNITVKDTFRINSIVYKKNSFINKKIYEEIIQEEEKKNIVFVANETFGFNNVEYAKGMQVPKKIYYEDLTTALKERVSFKVITTFEHGGTEYTKGNVIEFTEYEMLDTIKKDKVEFIVAEDITIEATAFTEGDIVTSDIYDALPVKFKTDAYFEIREDWYSVNDDGIYKYYFKEFEIDTDSHYGRNQGVKYSETYIYNKSEDKDSIWQLVENGEFSNYINGAYDKGSKLVTEPDQLKLYEKFEFETNKNIDTYEMRIGPYIKEIPYLKTNYEAVVDITNVDVEETPLIRYDYYNGVSFQAKVNNDVYVERGVTQAFEKHIKFSEIKTFEDMENYANGGFFTISKEDINLG